MSKRRKLNSGEVCHIDYKELLSPQTVLNNYMLNTEYPDPVMIDNIYREFPNAVLYICPNVYPKITVEILEVLIKNGWSANVLLECLSYYMLKPEHTKFLIPHLDNTYGTFSGSQMFMPSMFVNLESLELLLEHEIIEVDDSLMLNVFSRIVMPDKDYQNKLCKLLYKYHMDFKKWVVEKYKEIREIVLEETREDGTIDEEKILKYIN